VRPGTPKLFEEVEALVTSKKITIAVNVDPGFKLGEETTGA
jgi:hypothetical protein